MLVLAAAVLGLATGQSQLQYGVQAAGEEVLYYTTNARVRGLAATFQLCFEPTCKSTLSRTQYPDATSEFVVETLLTPENRYKALFTMGRSNILSVWDFEEMSLCMGVVHTEHVPIHCKFGPRAVGVCSGAEQECRFRGRINGQEEVVGVFTANQRVACGEDDFELQTDGGYHEMCAEKVADKTYLFSVDIPGRTAAMATVPSSTELYLFLDLRVHDELEVGLFSLVLVVAAVLWIRATNGGVSIGEKLVSVPTSFQRLIICDVSFSVASTGLFTIVAHKESLIPTACSLHFGDTYSWVATLLFVALLVVCNVVVVNCVRRPLAATSVTRAVILRHALEIQLMLSLYMFFPVSFGHEMRLLLGLFVGSVVLVVLGRDSRRMAQECDAQTLWSLLPLFLLEFHQCAMICIFPALYQSPGVLNDAAAPSAAAMASSMIFMGTLL